MRDRFKGLCKVYQHNIHSSFSIKASTRLFITATAGCHIIIIFCHLTSIVGKMFEGILRDYKGRNDNFNELIKRWK